MHKIILGVLVILIICAIMVSKKSCKKKCNCSKCRHKKYIDAVRIVSDEERASAEIRGLSDLEQSTASRGIVPHQNQPDHIANLWKCEYSHSKMVDGRGYLDTSFASDYPTPLRGAIVNQNVRDVSNMHLLSRFGGIDS